MELKDTAIVRAGIGPAPLYGYFYENSPVTIQPAGKFEGFIDDKVNVGFEGRMMEPAVYREVAKSLARIHLIPYEDCPLSIKYQDCDYWNWNTDCTYYHLRGGCEVRFYLNR